jgi:hypothetical protein
MKSYLPKRFDFRVRVFMEEPDFGKYCFNISTYVVYPTIRSAPAIAADASSVILSFAPLLNLLKMVK